MNVKRYFAPTAREALRALKEALGPDAIVLSNRAVEGGVEILALPGEAVGALQAANRAAVTARAGVQVQDLRRLIRQMLHQTHLVAYNALLHGVDRFRVTDESHAPATFVHEIPGAG